MAIKRKTKTKSNATGTVSVVFGSEINQVKRAAKVGKESAAGFVRRIVLAAIQRIEA